LAPEFNYFENWGQAGGGNHYIFNSVMEADQRHNFGASDTVIVCWTNVMREDRYTDRWQTLGNVTTCSIYNESYVRDAISERGCLIRDLAMVKATQVLLKQKRNVRWQFLSMCPIGNLQQFDDNVSGHQDVLALYQGVLNNIMPSYREIVFQQGWRSSGDPHPTPTEHLAYLDAVLPGWVTKTETRVKMHEESVDLNKDPRKTGMAQFYRL
jgi:hypothetical protein